MKSSVVKKQKRKKRKIMKAKEDVELDRKRKQEYIV